MDFESEDNESSLPEGQSHDEDIALFQEAMRDVVPLKKYERIIPTPNRSPCSVVRKTQPADRHAPVVTDVFTRRAADEITWSFARPGLQHNTLRKLRRGYWPVQATLDLHGLNRNQAYQALTDFLIDCVQQNYRCMLVIHGRGLGSETGQPVLKTLLRGWLVDCDDVLAFCQARPEQGGSGATLVLLRNGGKQ